MFRGRRQGLSCVHYYFGKGLRGYDICTVMINNCINNATKKDEKMARRGNPLSRKCSAASSSNYFIPQWIKGYFVVLSPLLYARQTEESFTWINLQQP